MVQVTGIDHIVIRVSDFKKSKAFYDRLLKFMGFKVLGEYSDAMGWSNGITRYWIQKVDTKYKKTRHQVGAIGFHHYAFELAERNDVDKLYTFLLKNKVKIVDPPTEYPEYGGPYYAVFFLDPDGLKLEGMHFPK